MDRAIHIEAGLVRQAQIEKDHVWGICPHTLDACRSRGGDLHLVRGGGKGLAYLLWNQVRIVVDQQQTRHDLLPSRPSRQAATPQIAILISFSVDC